MDNYFDQEIKSMEREITDLKTASQKSAATAPMVTKTVNVSTNLEYEDISYPWGSARSTVRYEVQTDYDEIIVPTLDWYFGDITQSGQTDQPTREIQLNTRIATNGKIIVELYFIGTENGANSDAQRVKNGETVTVSVNLTVRCTNDFNLRRL